ncbi:hypothetical protein [Candidatus Nitrosotenuis sp. DW1]|uniref:hypothetical protein n=1 Tax=Candidatus Nitrosotenuis sp. DW1 TaxID=2259672 RepID=UPI0015CD4BFA|nr:hypothetical protein [Candidatus Nitrosotenuis sp. DW1]
MSNLSIPQQIVQISELHPCPVQITIHTAKKIDSITKTAKFNPESIPALSVVLFNNKKYVADGGARVLGLKNADVKEFKANFYQVDSLEEVVALHVRLNQTSPLNPLKIIELARFFDGMSISEISKMCWLSESYVRMLENCRNLANDAHERLQSIQNELAKTLTEVMMPPYVLETICKIQSKSKHVKAVDMLEVSLKQLSGKKFSFPTHKYLEGLFEPLYDKPQREPVNFIEEIDNIEEETKSSKKQESRPYSIVTKYSTNEKENIKKILGNVPHQTILDIAVGDEIVKELESLKNIVVKLPREQRNIFNEKIEEIKKKSARKRFRLDMKKNTVSPIDEKNGVIVIQGESGKKSCFMLPEHTEFLDMQNGAEIHAKMITKSAQITKLAKLAKELEVKESLRVLVLSSNRI